LRSSVNTHQQTGSRALIILDGSILRTVRPDGSSVDLLRVIHTLEAEWVGAAPWIV
jgi:hypothetical protein